LTVHFFSWSISFDQENRLLVSPVGESENDFFQEFKFMYLYMITFQRRLMFL
jgi:hypothetical protein